VKINTRTTLVKHLTILVMMKHNLRHNNSSELGNKMEPSSQLSEAMCESAKNSYVPHLVFFWLHISCAWHKAWALYAMLARPASLNIHPMCDVIPSIHPSSLSLRPDPSIDRSPSGIAAVIRLIFSSIHPSVHPHSLRPDRVSSAC